jgi:hypothetical protein
VLQCYTGTAAGRDRVRRPEIDDRLRRSRRELLPAPDKWPFGGSPLVANGKNTTVLTRPRHVVPEQMLNEAANGCEAAVPRNGRVAAPRFRMIQKRQYSIGLDVFKCQIRYRFASLIGQKQEKELERIAVSPYGVSAGSARCR